MFSIVKVARDQGLSSLVLWGGKIRDPGNEVVKELASAILVIYAPNISFTDSIKFINSPCSVSQ